MSNPYYEPEAGASPRPDSENQFVGQAQWQQYSSKEDGITLNKRLAKLAAYTVIIASAVSLAACGGAPATKPSTPSPTPAPSPTQVDQVVLRAKGQEIFQKTVNCQACHGTDGKGLPNVAPDIRGESADDIKRALGGDAMSFIRMTNDDVDAVAAYLKSLQ